MIKSKRLSFCNIGRFIAPQTIHFDRFDSLNQIDAVNNLTGGSSGSGKSTIANARDWLFGMSDFSTNVLQSRLTKEHIWVEEELDWDGKHTVIRRDRKLSITVDGVETKGSSKLTEELLDQIIGMPRNLFHEISHKQQGKAGFFLQQTPAQMNAFLTDCLNLGQIRSKIDLIDLKTKDLTVLKAESQSSLQATQAALEANSKALQAIGEEPTTTIDSDLLEGWKGQYEAYKLKLIEIQEAHKTEKSDLETKRPNLVTKPFDSSALEAILVQEKELNKKVNEVLNQEKDRQAAINKEISKLKLDLSNQTAVIKTRTNTEITTLNAKLANTAMIIRLGSISKEEATKIAAQIKAIRAGTCYTCQQTWVSKTEEEKLLASLNEHKTKIMAATQAEADAEEIKTSIEYINASSAKDIENVSQSCLLQIQGLTEQAKPQVPPETVSLYVDLTNIAELKTKEKAKETAHNEEQNAANNQIMSVFFSDQKAMATKHQGELQAVNKGLEESRSQYERVNSEFKNYETNLANYRKVLKNLTDAQNSMNDKLNDITSKVGDITSKLEIAEEAKRCLKSYLNCSFDDALDSISQTATELLRSIPTMANATVRLEGTKEVGTGAIKEQVTAYLDNDGEIDINIKSLSGGERSALDMAIDLSVSNLIEERTNRGCDLLFLDEIFNGFDSTGIENAIEMLKTFGVNKKLFLVEHDGVAKEFVTSKITVIREGETSYIKNNP